MADSGVDTGNESSDNPVFDNSYRHLARLRNLVDQPMAFDIVGDVHEHFGKMKSSIKAKHCRHRSICFLRNKKLLFAAATNNTELVNKLLLSGADPNYCDEHKRSALHLAACRGYVDVVKTLTRHGANPNIKDALGNTPLHLAACTSQIPVIIALLDAGTDVSSHDRNGRNPIQLAQSKLKLIQMRPHDGQHEFIKKLMKEICLVVEMMIKYMKVQKANAADIESVRARLENVSTREQVDSEVQNLLDSLDSLKLR